MHVRNRTAPGCFEIENDGTMLLPKATFLVNSTKNQKSS